MKRFLSPNLGFKGRVIRAVGGTALIAAGLLLSQPDGWICVALVAAGGFVLYEAARGWCVMRACGVKTRF